MIEAVSAFREVDVQDEFATVNSVYTEDTIHVICDKTQMCHIQLIMSERIDCECAQAARLSAYGEH